MRSLVFALIATFGLHGAAGADGWIPRAEITVDASDPSSVLVQTRVLWEAGPGEPRSNIGFFLANDYSVESVDLEGKSLVVTSQPVPDCHLNRWTVQLPSATGEGATHQLTFSISGAAGAEGGHLLPGTGWFPQVEPESDEIPEHTTRFLVPQGMTGIAAGVLTEDGSWSSDTARPYAVWGAFTQTREVHAAAEGEPIRFDVFRRSADTKPAPRIDWLGRSIEGQRLTVGTESGSGEWKIIDVGAEKPRGGSRTIFWDEAFVRTAVNDMEVLVGRDLAGAVAASFWTESFRFRGGYAVWMSRSLALQIGDITAAALAPKGTKVLTEAALLRPRRASFMDGVSDDRPLDGVIAASDVGDWIVASRGALVAHLVAEAAPSRAIWATFLHDFRDRHHDQTVDANLLWQELRTRFPGQLDYLEPMFQTTDVPDFRLDHHGPSEGKLNVRYAVGVKNVGDVAGYAEIAALTHEGVVIRTYRVLVQPLETRTVMFAEVNRIAKVMIEPRGVTPQRDLTGEEDVVEQEPPADLDAYVPAFAFSTSLQEARATQDFHLDLDGAAISGFQGYVMWYSTEHGPSGASLMGSGNLTLKPTGSFAASFTEAMGRESLFYEGVRELWVRFPLAHWDEIRPQLGDLPTHEEGRELFERNRQIFDFSFPPYFSQGPRAEVPPTGSCMVIFTSAGGERLGFVRQILPNGQVRMRLWNHMRGETIWEEVR